MSQFIKQKRQGKQSAIIPTRNRVNAQQTESNLFCLLDTIIHFMMSQEKFDTLAGRTMHNKIKTKYCLPSMESLSEALEPLITKDYNTVFKNDQNETLKLISTFEIYVRYIAIAKLPDNTTIQKLLNAYGKDTKLVGSICKKVFKHSDSKSPEPSQEQIDYLNLLDYCVNLVFIERNLAKLIIDHYDTVLLRKRINRVLSELKPHLANNIGLVFKESLNNTDLIEEYRKHVKFTGDIRVDNKIVLSQLIEAWNINSKSLEGVANKVLA